jgi:hypothetical protein
MNSLNAPIIHMLQGFIQEGFQYKKQKYQIETPYLLMNLPYYLGTHIPEYINYFIKEPSIIQIKWFKL